MKIAYYFNFSCPHCFIAMENMKKALENLESEYEIVFYPTERVFREVDLEDLTMQYRIKNKLKNIDRVDTYYVDRIMEYCNEIKKQREWYELVVKSYYIENQDISDFDVVKDLAKTIGLNNEEIDSLLSSKKLNNQEYTPPSIKIDEVLIEGIKDDSYYTFAFSCFFQTLLEEEKEWHDCDSECCAI